MSTEFNVADLTASMRLNKGTFDRDVQATNQGLQSLADRARSAGSSLGSALAGGLTTASVATVALIGGTTALLASVVKTGVSYNMLQQNSRAALATLLGGAEAANAQMDKLDDFARNSPFGKDLFISGQQQLLAFGMEAEKVIPVMDAVQQSVAAAGGSSDDISGLIEVFAKIQSSGKITAEDLNQFGARGVDAATLMGKAFGKTGSEMREDITDGALGAEDAIAALTEQMQVRFGGATAKVKEQMVGALDRVKGATRDIGSLLARPFVDPKGGGMAVEWTNKFADGLRSLELVLGPVAATLMDRLSPVFVAVSTGLDAANKAIRGFNLGDFNSKLAVLGEMVPGVAGLAGAFLAMSGNLPIVGGVLSALGISLNPLVVGLAAAAAASPEFRDAIGDVLKAAAPLVPAIVNLAGAVAKGLTSAFAAAAPMVELLVDPIGQLSEVGADVIGVLADVIQYVSELPTPMLAASAAVAAVFMNMESILGVGESVFGPLVEAAKEFGDEVRTNLAANAAGLPSLFQGIQSSGLQGAGGLQTLGSAAQVAGRNIVTGVRAAASGLLNMLGGPWGIALMAGAAILGHFAGEAADTKAHVDNLTESLDKQTGQATLNTLDNIADKLAEDEVSWYEWGINKKDVGEAAKMLGTDLQGLAEIIGGNGKTYDEYIAKLKEYPGLFGNANEGMAEWGNTMGLSEAEAENMRGSMEHLVTQVESGRSAFLESKENIKELSGAEKEADEKARDFAAALDVMSDATSTTSQKVSALNDALAVLNGDTPSADEAIRSLNDSTRSLAGDMVDAEGNVISFTEAIDAATGQINTKSEAGSNLSASLSDYIEKSKGAAVALHDEGAGAAEVQASLEAARGEWIRMAEQSGVSAETAALAWDRMAQGNPGEITTIITADTTGVEDKVANANGVLDTIDARSAVANLWADDTVFAQKMAGALGDMDAINGVISTATVDLDPAAAEAKRLEILDKLAQLVATNPTVRAEMNATGLNREIMAANIEIKNLEKQKPTPKVLADIEDLRQKVATAQTLMDGIKSKTVTVTTNIVENRMPGTGGSAIREAQGGIVKAFADGGFHFQGRDLTPMSAIAQVVPSNTWRVVGDNLSHPEMYVPMDGSARSREILREGVDMMGFALVPKNSVQGLDLGAVMSSAGGAPSIPVQFGGDSRGTMGGDTYQLIFHGVKTDDKEELAEFLVNSIKHSRRGGVFSEG